MTIGQYISLFLSVLKDFRVIITVVVMIFVIEFAKFVTTYRKRPPKPKKSKTVAVAAEPPKTEEIKEGDGGEASAADENSDDAE